MSRRSAAGSTRSARKMLCRRRGAASAPAIAADRFCWKLGMLCRRGSALPHLHASTAAPATPSQQPAARAESLGREKRHSDRDARRFERRFPQRFLPKEGTLSSKFLRGAPPRTPPGLPPLDPG